jgi:hypothetical protein
MTNDERAKVTISAKEYDRLRGIESALKHIVENKKNFTNKHPLFRNEAEWYLDRCAALLDKGD